MSTSGNDVRARKAATAGVFSRAALTYDRVGPKFFSYFGKRLVDLTDLQPNAKVLDVATGRGAVLFPAIEKLGTGGYVTGIDIAGGMITHTSAELTLRRVPNARVTEMDAEFMNAFQNSAFDNILCGFGLFFFQNLNIALHEFHRVLKPGGLVSATSWGITDERWDWLAEVGLRPPKRVVEHELGNQRPSHHDGGWWKYLEAAFQEAGFVNQRVIYEEQSFSFNSPEEWWESEWSHGARAFLEKMDFESLDRAKAAAFAKLEELQQTEGKIEHTYRVYFSFAQKPTLTT
jgi:ubiquinone/menaquinone biosynthesis C-methylase UbiE